eukprot:g44184.t1
MEPERSAAVLNARNCQTRPSCQPVHPKPHPPLCSVSTHPHSQNIQPANRHAQQPTTARRDISTATLRGPPLTSPSSYSALPLDLATASDPLTTPLLQSYGSTASRDRSSAGDNSGSMTLAKFASIKQLHRFASFRGEPEAANPPILEDETELGHSATVHLVPSSPPSDSAENETEAPVSSAKHLDLVARRVSSNIKKSLKANLVPGVAMTTFALVLMLLYYNVQAVQDGLNNLADFKQRAGFLFSAVSTSLMGGVLPGRLRLEKAVNKQELLEQQRKKGYACTGCNYEIAILLFLTLFWFYKGVEVDALYRLMAILFGTGRELSVVAKKVAADQFVYNPLYATWSLVIPYRWKDLGFSFTALRKEVFTEGFVVDFWLTAMITTWMIWIPATIIVYSFPSPLQIPLFNIVLAFFTLIVVARRE